MHKLKKNYWVTLLCHYYIRILHLLFNFFLSTLLLIMVTGMIILWYVIPTLPDIYTLENVRMQVPLRIYSSDLSLIAEFGEKRRTPLDIDNVPPKLIEAFLAAEDDRFYTHPGVDWPGLVRAAYLLLKTGEKAQGGSTITMQVARNFFLNREKTYRRKLSEILLALKIERELSKDDILELYLNKIYLGQRAYGVGAAATVYYGKDIGELTLPQLAMLAALPKAPSTINPVKNPEKSLIRRNYVLQRMRTLDYINDDEYKTAMATPVTASIHSASIRIKAPYVAEMVRSNLIEKHGKNIYNDGLIVTTTVKDQHQHAANQALKKALVNYDERHGYRGAEGHIEYDQTKPAEELDILLDDFSAVDNLYPALVTRVSERSIDVYLSGIGQIEVSWKGLEWARKYITENRRGNTPNSAEEIVKVGNIIRLTETETGHWKLSQIPEIEGALISLDPSDGAILALTGGFNFYKNNFNRVTQAKRQAGSGFKPFIYSAAIEAGKTAATIINDAPIVFDDLGIKNEWRPKNYSGESRGPIRLREALTHSVNLVSVRLLHLIGLPSTLEHLKKFGFSTTQLPNNLSLALGSAEVSPWELVRAYSVFANGGHLIEPYYIDRIETYDHEMMYKTSPTTACDKCIDEVMENDATEIAVEKDNDLEPETNDNIAPKVISTENIWIMNSMLRDVIRRGTGKRALALNRRDLSGKTGTTNDQHDTWFSGFNSNIVTVCWVGFDKFTPMGANETGARAALPMWVDYMRVALGDTPEAIVTKPDSLINVLIDPDTGLPTSPDNPKGLFEVFKPGNIPKSVVGKKQADDFLRESVSDSIPEQLF